jgi:hypothetical protein
LVPSRPHAAGELDHDHVFVWAASLGPCSCPLLCCITATLLPAIITTKSVSTAACDPQVTQHSRRSLAYIHTYIHTSITTTPQPAAARLRTATLIAKHFEISTFTCEPDWERNGHIGEFGSMKAPYFGLHSWGIRNRTRGVLRCCLLLSIPKFEYHCLRLQIGDWENVAFAVMNLMTMHTCMHAM